MTTRPRASARTVFTAAALIAGATLLAGCETTNPGATGAATAPPMTHARAAELCWMSTEKASPGMNLDKRADLVDKCIDDKMKGAAAAPKG
jgi:hypothetical protein